MTLMKITKPERNGFNAGKIVEIENFYSFQIKEEDFGNPKEYQEYLSFKSFLAENPSLEEAIIKTAIQLSDEAILNYPKIGNVNGY